jgi:hypothetical protein
MNPLGTDADDKLDFWGQAQAQPDSKKAVVTM